MESKCENANCVSHTPVVHGDTCQKSGKNKCKDYLHNKECWTKEDVRLLISALDNGSVNYE